MKKLRAAIYARTAAQSRKTIDEQIKNSILATKIMMLECNENDIYVDDGCSGRTVEGRDGFSSLTNNLNFYDVVIMRDISRIARNYIITNNVLNSFISYGLHVYFYEDDQIYSSVKSKSTFLSTIKANINKQLQQRGGSHENS
jgi:DNA invertase Pin-like site-specific DNA recombinase